jgi:hypothetical protein
MIVALDSGPRMVTDILPRCLVTTISQCVDATELKKATGSLRVRHIFVAIGELGRCSSSPKI